MVGGNWQVKIICYHLTVFELNQLMVLLILLKKYDTTKK